MLLFLATELQTNAFDTEFAGKLVQTVIALGVGFGVARLGRRKPSVDVDLAELAQRVDALEKEMQSIDRKLDKGATIHMELKEAQATNTARISDILNTVHDLSTRINAMPGQIVQLIAKK